MKKQQGRWLWVKRLLIVEIIVCYMATLVVVSYLRGPERYQTITDVPMITTKDLISVSGEKSEDNDLSIYNTDTGVLSEYRADISLKGLDQIRVSFSVDCSAKCSGSTLFVDLYEPEAEYDYDEQQVAIMLEEGKNPADFSLNLGKNHPEHAFFRLFMTGPTECVVRGLEVYPEKTLPSVSMRMIFSVIACFAILVGTGIIYIYSAPKVATIKMESNNQ